MANVYLQDSTLTAIGNAIRTKAGNSNMLLPSEMAAAINNLPSGGAGKMNIYVGDATVDNRLQYTSAQTKIKLSDMGVTASTFKNLRSVNGNMANGKAIFNSVFTTRLISADRAVTWEVYPQLAALVEYPDEVKNSVNTVFGAGSEIYPAAFACSNSISSTSTATTVWPILNGITGSAWQAMGFGVVQGGYLYLGFYNYIASGKTAVNPVKYIIGEKGYVYWRY